MKLQDQVCAESQAIKLNQLGIDQRSLFAYEPEGGTIAYDEEVRSEWDGIYVSAFTVAELGVMLPREIIVNNNELKEHSWYAPKKKKYCIQYRLLSGTICDCDVPEDFAKGDTEAEARAAMLIHLIETSQLSASEVNDRLNF